jgi:hypothetical protein
MTKDPIKDFIDSKKKMEKKYSGYTFEVHSYPPVFPACPHGFKGLWCPECTTLPEDENLLPTPPSGKKGEE